MSKWTHLRPPQRKQNANENSNISLTRGVPFTRNAILIFIVINIHLSRQRISACARRAKCTQRFLFSAGKPASPLAYSQRHLLRATAHTHYSHQQKEKRRSLPAYPHSAACSPARYFCGIVKKMRWKTCGELPICARQTDERRPIYVQE